MEVAYRPDLKKNIFFPNQMSKEVSRRKTKLQRDRGMRDIYCSGKLLLQGALACQTVGDEAGEKGQALSESCWNGSTKKRDVRPGGYGLYSLGVGRRGVKAVFLKGFDCSPQKMTLYKLIRAHCKFILLLCTTHSDICYCTFPFLVFNLFLLRQGLIINPSLSSNSLSPCFSLPVCQNCRQLPPCLALFHLS